MRFCRTSFGKMANIRDIITIVNWLCTVRDIYYQYNLIVFDGKFSNWCNRRLYCTATYTFKSFKKIISYFFIMTIINPKLDFQGQILQSKWFLG